MGTAAPYAAAKAGFPAERSRSRVSWNRCVSRACGEGPPCVRVYVCVRRAMHAYVCLRVRACARRAMHTCARLTQSAAGGLQACPVTSSLIVTKPPRPRLDVPTRGSPKVYMLEMVKLLLCTGKNDSKTRTHHIATRTLQARRMYPCVSLTHTLPLHFRGQPFATLSGTGGA